MPDASSGVWLALALACGAAARFWNLSGSSLFTDEAYTFSLSALRVPALLHALASHDFHPPLFYLATHYAMAWLRWPLWDYRYLTAAFGLLTIAATWGSARRMFGAPTAAIAAFVVALQPVLVQHDRLYRMYAVTVALSALSWWLLLEIEQAAERKKAVLLACYALAAIALPFIDYLGAVMLVCQLAYAVTRSALRPALLALGASAAAFALWLPQLLQQVPLGGIALSPPALDRGLLASLRGAFAGGLPVELVHIRGFDAVCALALAATLVAGALLAKRSALPFWLAAIVVQIVASILLAKNLAYFPRYLLIDVPPVAIAFGLIVATAAATRLKPLCVGAMAGATVLLGLALSNTLFNPYYQFPDWYAVNALLLKYEQPGDAIVLDAGYEFLVVRDYTAFRRHDIVSFMNPADFAAVDRWIAARGHKRVWYVEHQNFYWDPHKAIASGLSASRPELVRWRQEKASPVDAVAVSLFGEPSTAQR
ncbi:MAG: hypothetical protein DLM53_12195 [Candidatus Eremiobacter antarcticus]|nr:MAG: hypothetical protein DLM53_12195 [Candidatus Eremiobacter sp. RRmetagenome_bin22]